jgi:hypothetical protein
MFGADDEHPGAVAAYLRQVMMAIGTGAGIGATFVVMPTSMNADIASVATTPHSNP